MLLSAATWIADYFHFERRHTNFKNEIRGGFVTFLTMSYIMLVNPQVVTDWMGGDNLELFPAERTALSNNIASSTAVTCSIGSILMGVVANMPFAVGPGMSMNSVFAGSIPYARNATQFAKSSHDWNVAVTASLFGGLLVVLLAVVGLAPKILKALPDYLKASIRVGIGLFQCFLALRTMRIIISEPTDLLKFVDEFSFSDRGEDGVVAQILFGVTLVMTSTLYVLGAQAPILVSIVFTTAICWIFQVGGVTIPHVPLSTPVFDKAFWKYDFDAYAHELSAIGISLSYAVITLFDVGGAMFAILTIIHEADELAHGRTNTKRDAEEAIEGEEVRTPRNQLTGDRNEVEEGDDEESREVDGLVRRRRVVEECDDVLADDRARMVSTTDARKVYCVVGVTTMLSSSLGCSPTVVFLECLAGVASGARTGFSSIVTGLLFLLSLPFGPIFHNVPACAAVPALVLIGCFMILSVGEIPWHDNKKAFAAFVCIMLMPFTASITPGIVAGVVTHVLLHAVHRGGHWWRQRHLR